ncbi:TAXI family TRAP transporter solute-binding subunit, partial [Nonomuraea lactucae]|uniref:TAXI family TRAP transporter solute-binding subunit n=1 Tax=Nonomuraea lactucae TaxID=2249762 RepID=UPI000DE31FA3
LADVAADAVAGRPPFRAPRPIVALARLYDNYVQLVVRDDGPVRAVRDLKGRRVSVGGEGSGTAVTGERILEVAGLTDKVELRRLDVGASARALAAGQIDAFFWSGGLPSAAITDLRRGTGVRLLDLKSTAESLTREYGDLYTETTVPASVYGLSSPVTTVSVPNYLVAGRELPPGTAYWLTRLLFEGQPRLAEVHPEARRLDPGSAIMTYPLDLHEGAARWYRSSHR